MNAHQRRRRSRACRFNFQTYLVEEMRRLESLSIGSYDEIAKQLQSVEYSNERVKMLNAYRQIKSSRQA